MARIRPTEAVRRIAERWEETGEKPMTDKMAASVKLGILKRKIKEALSNINKNTWKKVSFCLDSGAGETVMAESDLPEVLTKESWGSKHGQKCEVANGEEIHNKGEKKFVAHMVRVDGGDSGGRGVTAQVWACIGQWRGESAWTAYVHAKGT